MNINNYNQTNFGANFINKVNIKRLDSKTNLYNACQASFVQFDPKNKNDLSAMSKAVKTWQGDHFARTIVNNAERIVNGMSSSKINHIYLLTTQKEKFDKLNRSEILGVAQMRSNKRDSDELWYLQVKPDTKYGEENRTFKSVGSGILNSLKAIYNKKITLLSSYFAANFYETQGFDLRDPMLLEYEWVNKDK